MKTMHEKEDLLRKNIHILPSSDFNNLPTRSKKTTGNRLKSTCNFHSSILILPYSNYLFMVTCFLLEHLGQWGHLEPCVALTKSTHVDSHSYHY